MAVGNKTLNRAQLVFQFTSKFVRELKILTFRFSYILPLLIKISFGF